MDARGVLIVHSAPLVLRPHIEWAMSHVLGVAYRLTWQDQPAAPGTCRAECAWDGPAGSAARLASALRGWSDLRFEVTEEVAHGRDGARYMQTPSLGIFYSMIDSAGNALVTEDRIRYALDVAGTDSDAIHREIARALGQAWDDELEPFRSMTPAGHTGMRIVTA